MKAFIRVSVDTKGPEQSSVLSITSVYFENIHKDVHVHLLLVQ